MNWTKIKHIKDYILLYFIPYAQLHLKLAASYNYTNAFPVMTHIGMRLYRSWHACMYTRKRGVVLFQPVRMYTRGYMTLEAFFLTQTRNSFQSPCSVHQASGNGQSLLRSSGCIDEPVSSGTSILHSAVLRVAARLALSYITTIKVQHAIARHTEIWARA